MSYMDTGSKELLSVNDTFRSPLKERPGFDFLLVMKTERKEKSKRGRQITGYRRGEGERLLISFDEVQGTSTTLIVLV